MITGKAKLAGVMGWPVSHSRSPALHNYWLNDYGIDGAYVPLAVAPEDLNAALCALPKLGFRGVNLTIPHKESAMGMMDALEDSAKRIGAVNTVIVEDGALIGANTDAYGFLENLKSGCDLSNYLHAALVVGAGGASRAVIAALMDAGAKSIYLTNRTREKSDALLSAFPSVQISTGTSVMIFSK